MNTIYFFSIEIVITLISIFFDMVMLTTPKKSKAHILYVISLISIFVFCINQVITIVHNKYTVPYLIINCVYCLVLMTTLLISLCEINRTIKLLINRLFRFISVMAPINQKSVTNAENTSKLTLSRLISLKFVISVYTPFSKIRHYISILLYFNDIIKCTVKIPAKLYKHLHGHVFVLPHF